jgi:hypothetical protein
MDFNDISTVTNNYELDSALIGPTAQQACVVNVGGWLDAQPIVTGGRAYETYTKPIGAYMLYISQQYIPTGETTSHTFEKMKGYTRSFSLSVSVTASVGANIMGCDASLSVTTGFTYTNEITQATTETWEDSVTGPAT